MADYARPDVLVSTDWLAERLDDPNLRIIEVDEDTTAYGKGHLRNAVAWNWFEDLHATPQRDYVDQNGLSRLLQHAGVDRDTTMVLYGGNNWFAAYAYWLLHYCGFDDVKLLDGGRKAWELEDRELVRIGGPDRDESRALRDHVLASVGTSTFVDVRSPEEYRGEVLAPPHSSPSSKAAAC
jgi:thiosulfate/3-mercaptopyruvate sulfurtransferase